MSADIVLDGVANDEDEFHDAQDDFEDENEPATQIRKTGTLKQSFARNQIEPCNSSFVSVGEVIQGDLTLRSAADAKDDDCTEDEIPDITGTENVAGDQMTISVDEIEDIPPTDENNVDETGVPEDYVETQANANEEVDDIPDDIVESADEDAAAKENETAKETEQEAAENQKNEEEPAKEKAASLEEAEPFKDEPAADEEIEQDAADVLSKKTIEEYGLDAKEKPVAEEALAIKQEELAAEEAKQEELPAEEKSAENQHDFQLKEPPKRTRSPNELDAGVEIEVNDEPPQTSKSSENDIQSVTGGSEADGAEKPVENENLRRTSLVSGAAGSGIDSVPQTPKSPAASVPKSPLANGVLPGTPAPATPKSAAALASPHTPKATAGFETPKTKTAFIFEEASPVPTPKSPKKTTFDEDVLSTASSKSKSKSPPKSPRSPRKVRRSRIIKSPEAEPEPEEPLEVEPEAETPAGEESQAAEESKLVEIEEEQQAPSSEKQESAAEAESEEVVEKTKNELDTETEAPITRSRARIQSPSSPRGDTNSASRVPAPHDYIPYDQDSHREVVPPHLPTSTSVSSWTASDRESYQAISPWVDYSSKYRSEHTTGVPSHTPSYTAMFDDIVNIGPFSSNLYATSRLLERSRSRTRQRRSAMRSQRASSNYYRFASQFPPPLRTRDYSTPPISTFNKAPSRAGSFISFMEFSAAKNFDLARSRGSLYDSNQALSRTSSRGDIDYYLGAGRISRVDSYVNNLNSRYEWHVPSNYETYRSASRSRNAAYTPINEYTSYANPLYEDARRARDTGMIRSMYEGRIDDLQRNLSKERYERDRLRSRYTLVANQLEQACKQMDLLKSSSYALQRSGSTLRTFISPMTYYRTYRAIDLTNQRSEFVTAASRRYSTLSCHAPAPIRRQTTLLEHSSMDLRVRGHSVYSRSVRGSDTNATIIPLLNHSPSKISSNLQKYRKEYDRQGDKWDTAFAALKDTTKMNPSSQTNSTNFSTNFNPSLPTSNNFSSALDNNNNHKNSSSGDGEDNTQKNSPKFPQFDTRINVASAGALKCALDARVYNILSLPFSSSSHCNPNSMAETMRDRSPSGVRHRYSIAYPFTVANYFPLFRSSFTNYNNRRRVDKPIFHRSRKFFGNNF